MTPRAVGFTCVAAATALGLLYLAAAGAPTAHLLVNALSLVIGIASFALLRSTGLTARMPGGVLVALGGVLLATALVGVSVEGASRWIRVGGISLQTSLVVLPVMLVAYARDRGLGATIGIVLAAFALALQPDRAMAGILAAALVVLALYRRDRWVLSSLAVALVGFAIAMIRPDSLAAVAFVDGILFTSFHVHPLAGIAVVGGSILLTVPALVGYRVDPDHREVHAVFAIVWIGMIAAAALGNYPTPIVGYGGSAILGYALGLTFMPGNARSAAVAGAHSGAVDPGAGDGHRDPPIDGEHGIGRAEHLQPKPA